MKHIQSIIAICLAASMVLLSSCIGEDSDCAPVTREVTMLLRCDINTTGADVFTTVVEYVDLYVYDDAGVLRQKTERLTKEQLSATNYIHKMTLDEGNYTLVAWMNASDEFEVSEIEELSTARLKLIPCEEGGVVKANTQPIYHGSRVLTVNPETGIVVINMMKNTNYVNVTTNFNRTLPQSVNLQAYITGTNGHYTFENNCPGGSPVYTYMPQPAKARAAYPFAFTTQRLMVDDDLRLVIIKQEAGKDDEQLADIALTPTIMRNPLYNEQQDLDKHDTYQLEFTLEHNGDEDTWAVVGIRVDDWTWSSSGTGL